MKARLPVCSRRVASPAAKFSTRGSEAVRLPGHRAFAGWLRQWAAGGGEKKAANAAEARRWVRGRRILGRPRGVEKSARRREKSYLPPEFYSERTRGGGGRDTAGRGSRKMLVIPERWCSDAFTAAQAFRGACWIGLGWAPLRRTGITAGHRGFRSYLVVHAGAENRTGTRDCKGFLTSFIGWRRSSIVQVLLLGLTLRTAKRLRTTSTKYRRGPLKTVFLISFVEDLLYQRQPY